MLSPDKLLYLKLVIVKQRSWQPEAAASGPKTTLLPLSPAKVGCSFPTAFSVLFSSPGCHTARLLAVVSSRSIPITPRKPKLCPLLGLKQLQPRLHPRAYSGIDHQFLSI